MTPYVRLYNFPAVYPLSNQSPTCHGSSSRWANRNSIKYLLARGRAFFSFATSPSFLVMAGRFVEIAKKMAEEDGAKALILGCTELPLLFEGRSLPVPVLDTMELHIQALINAILEDPA